MVTDYRNIFYSTVLSQTISTCGKFLFVGNNFGDIFVFSIRQFHANEYDEEYSGVSSYIPNSEPIQVLSVGGSVNALAFHRNFLIVGTVGLIFGYNWDDEKFMLTKKAWDVKILTVPESMEPTDINYFSLEKGSDFIYVGCGDSFIYQVNLEDGRIMHTFRGHNDYIHCVTGSENRLFSASEDGKIIFWDTRDNKQSGKLEPYKNSDLARPEMGIWQGTVSVTDDWLVCGGGPRCSMWHLRSLECTTILPFPDRAHCCGFIDDLIFIAGEFTNLHQYTFNGEVTAEIPVSGPSVYSVAYQNEPLKLMSIGGASNSLDICTNFNYKDAVIKLYKSHKT